jgi:hypothetical protein
MVLHGRIAALALAALFVIFSIEMHAGQALAEEPVSDPELQADEGEDDEGPPIDARPADEVEEEEEEEEEVEPVDVAESEDDPDDAELRRDGRRIILAVAELR